MSNIALNKLPLEKDSWERPEESTNGNSSHYNDQNGFAHAPWPCTYTIDLETEQKLSVIRFLLWDGLGKGNTVVNDRKYTFSLSISTDGKVYTTVYSNQNEGGGNGWYSFKFINDIYARFVRLTGHFNTANKAFHMVEFEIHDQIPNPINSNNIKGYDIVYGPGSPSDERLSLLIDKEVSKKSGLFKGIEEKIKDIDKNLKISRESIDNAELLKQTHGFLEESIKNKINLGKWLKAAIITLVIFLILLYYFVFWDEQSIKIIRKSALDENVKPFTYILLAAYYATKTLFISTILFVLGWMLKNYRSEKHNYVINKHKAMTLTVAIGVITKEDFVGSDRQNIFNKGMEITFTHQPTGFSKEEVTQPSIINTMLQKDNLLPNSEK